MSEEIKDTNDYGYSEIEIAKVGDYNGSDSNGNPVEEHFTEDSLKKIVDEVNTSGNEILLDKQHQSMKTGLERDDSACGWIKSLSFRNGSIFGKCFWTKLGHELVTSRIMRFISPVFHIGEDGIPQKLVNVALVNTPAITDIKPVINQASEREITISNKKDILDMDINELKQIIRDTISEIKSEDEKKEVIEEKIEEKVEEITENSCGQEKPEEKEIKNECACEEKTEETVENTCTNNEEPVEEEEKEEKKEEVIKIEALNSAPTPILNSEPEWKKLTGKAFRDWCEKGMYR